MNASGFGLTFSEPLQGALQLPCQLMRYGKVRTVRETQLFDVNSDAEEGRDIRMRYTEVCGRG